MQLKKGIRKMNNNIIFTNDGDAIGMQADLKRYVLRTVADRVGCNKFDEAQSLTELLPELDQYDTPNLLVISNHNGMGWTINTYRPNEEQATLFANLDKPFGKGYLVLSLSATYLELVGKLGEPKCGASADGKARVEWHIRLNNAHNTEFSIYDWKEDAPITEVTRWHVGGTDKDTPYIRNFLFNEKHFEEL